MKSLRIVNGMRWGFQATLAAELNVSRQVVNDLVNRKEPDVPVSEALKAKVLEAVAAERAQVLELIKPQPTKEDLLVEMAVRSFTAQILHGDSAHKIWLLQACEDFLTGKEIQNQNA